MNHLGGAYEGGDVHTKTEDIWGYLLIEYGIKSVLDIGCGYGHNAKWFLDMGCDVIGVEGDLEAVEKSVIPKERIVVHDYTLGAYIPDRQIDLVLATEFVEHVEQKYEKNWIATVKHGRYFLMCHAVPGQGGHHHVNEQERDYWVERIKSEGFDYYPAISETFRQTCKRKPAPWGRNTLLFFVNAND